jgi:hypothetical protein
MAKTKQFTIWSLPLCRSGWPFLYTCHDKPHCACLTVTRRGYLLRPIHSRPETKSSDERRAQGRTTTSPLRVRYGPAGEEGKEPYGQRMEGVQYWPLTAGNGRYDEEGLRP